MRLALIIAAGLLVARTAMAQPVEVSIVPAAVRSYRPEITALARGRSTERIVIDAPFSGVMAPLPQSPGASVAHNAVIARVLPLRLASEVEAATAQAQSERKAYAQTQILVRGGLVTSTRLAQAKARMRRAVAALQGLQARLAYGTVHAPFPGTVDYQVPAGAWVTPGTAIADLSGTGGFYLTAPVRPEAAHWLTPGLTARISAGSHHWPGQIYAVSARADRGGLITVYLHCRCELLPGEYARITIRGPTAPGLAVPQDAIVMNDGKAVIFRVEAGHARAVTVVVVHANRHWAWVQGKIAAGDPVIVSGAGKVSSGTPVQDSQSVPEPR